MPLTIRQPEHTEGVTLSQTRRNPSLVGGLIQSFQINTIQP